MADEKATLATDFVARLDKSFDKVLNRLSTSFKKLDKGIKNLEKSSKTMAKSGKAMQKALNKTGLAAGNMNKQIGRSHTGVIRLLNAMKVTTAYGIAAGGIYKIVGALQTAGREIVNFDQGLKNIQAIGNVTNEELAGMEDIMMSLAVETKFSTTEMAEGMVYLAQSGFSAAESMQAIRAVATLAAGTLSSLSLTSDLITTTLRAFNLEAIESGRVADVMATAINKSKLSIDKLRTAFNYVGASAAQIGLSLEETAASMMVLANNGLRASTIGTGMRQVLSRLMAPSRKLRDTFAAFSIELDEVNPRLVGFENAVMSMAKVIWDHEKNVVNMQKAYELFGLRGAQAAAIITKAFVSGDWDEAKEKLGDIGSAEAMMAKQAEGAAFKIKNLQDRMVALAQKIASTGLLDMFKDFIDLLRDVVDWLIRVSNTLEGRLILNITLLTTAVLLLVKAFRVLQGLMIALGLAAGSMNPLVAAIAVTLSVIAAQWYTYNTQQKVARDEAIKHKAALSAQLDSFHQFREVLEKVRKKGGDVNGVLERMIIAHPELADMVDVSKASQEELNEAFKEFERLKAGEIIEAAGRAYAAQIPIVRDLIEDMNEANRQLDAFQRRQKGEIGWGEALNTGKWSLLGNIVKDMFKGVDERTNEATEAINNYKLGMERLQTEIMETARVINRLHFAEQAEAKQYLEDHLLRENMTEDQILSINRFIAVVLEKAKVLKDLKKKGRKVEKVTGHELGSGKEKDEPVELGRFRDMYNKMDDEGQVFLLKELKSLAKRKKAAIKFYESMGWKAKQYNHLLIAEDQKLYDKIVEMMGAGERLANKEVLAARKEGIKQKLSMLKESQKEEIKIVRSAGLGEKEEMEAIFQVRKIYADKEIDLLRQLSVMKDAELEKQYEKDKRAIEETITNKIMEQDALLKLEEAHNAKINQNAEELAAKVKEILKGARTEELQYYKTMIDRWLREGKISMEEYLALLKELKDEGIVTWQEYQDKAELANASVFGAFILGMKQSLREVKSWKEEMQDLGANVIDVLADKSVTLFDVLVNGSKSVSEAFKDWAKNMLSYISQVIMKLLILKAIQALMSGIGSGASAGSGAVGGGTSFGGSGGGSGFLSSHSGYWPGKTLNTRIVNPEVFRFAPKFHTGLKQDEMAAIIRKNEYVLTPQQMKDVVNNRQGGGMSINVPINISDKSTAEKLKRQLPKEIENTVLRVMRQQLV